MYRALPFDCGASLPTVERYTDWRFKRVAGTRVFWRVGLDQDAVVELRAFLELVTPYQASRMFHWDWSTRKRWAEIMAETPVEMGLVEANARALGPEQALGLLNAMRDGGWTQGPLPHWFKLALRAWRDEGLSVAQIAEKTGLGYWTVQYGFRVPHHERLAVAKRGLAI